VCEREGFFVSSSSILLTHQEGTISRIYGIYRLLFIVDIVSSLTRSFGDDELSITKTITAMSKKTTDSSPESRDEQIRLAAYYLWEEKGKNNGEDQEDWFKAEEYVNN
jgi:hypothetical protein